VSGELVAAGMEVGRHRHRPERRNAADHLEDAAEEGIAEREQRYGIERSRHVVVDPEHRARTVRRSGRLRRHLRSALGEAKAVLPDPRQRSLVVDRGHRLERRQRRRVRRCWLQLSHRTTVTMLAVSTTSSLSTCLNSTSQCWLERLARAWRVCTWSSPRAIGAQKLKVIGSPSRSGRSSAARNAVAADTPPNGPMKVQ